VVEFEKFQETRIKGASALQWSRRTTRLIFVVLICLALVLGEGGVEAKVSAGSPAKEPLQVLFQILLYLFFASLVTFFISGINSRISDAAERSKGYSTLPLQDGAFDVIDLETGLILRSASQPRLRNREDIAIARKAALARVEAERSEYPDQIGHAGSTSA
jgi:hypothetical protein